MPFSTYCTHKGCGNYMQPYLDPSNDKIYCSSCDKELTNITHFIKAQMKSFKQFKPKKKVAFSIKCSACLVEDVPKLVNDQIMCGNCNKPLTNLSEPFKIILKQKLKSNQDN